MLGLDIPVLRRDGQVRHLTAAGWPGAINLPTLSDALYRSARWLRVFVARPVQLSERRLRALVELSPEDVRDRIQRGAALMC